MNLKAFLVFASVFLWNMSSAQNIRTVDIDLFMIPSKDKPVFEYLQMNIPRNNTNSRLFARLEILKDQTQIKSLEISPSPLINGWPEYEKIELDQHNYDHDDFMYNSNIAESSIIELPSNTKAIQVRLTMVDGYVDEVPNLALKYYEDSFVDAKHLSTSAGCICPSILYKSRTDWACPDGTDSPKWLPVESKAKTFVIHHQAGNANPPYDAVVRSIWNFHTNVDVNGVGNGWGDIGYNWLIAPDGTVYQGRAWVLNQLEEVRGGHMCACNSNKIGICILGNLTNQGPTKEAYDALVKLIANKACQFDIVTDSTDITPLRKPDPCAERLAPNIIGHMDGCPDGYTACPGAAFAPKMDSLRNSISSYLSSCLSSAENISFDEIRLFPNPSFGILTVEGLPAEDFSIKIVNNLGQHQSIELFSKGADYLIINTSQLISGYYNIIITSQLKKTYTVKNFYKH